MDKYFIQNAFKTLDEIEEEMANDKKSLKESLSEDATAVEEPMDRDEFEDKYLGKMAVVGGNGNFKGNAVQITKLIDFNGDFEKSVWEGVTEDGLKLTLAGDELEVKLEEKLPRDLARAYQRTAAFGADGLITKRNEYADDRVARADTYFPTRNNHRKTPIDFEKANYKDISNEDRNEIIKAYKKKKYQLRLLFIPDVGDEKDRILVMWDKDGNLLTSPKTLRAEVGTFKYKEANPESFTDLVKLAKKIYVTDEEENRMEVPSSVQNMSPEEIADAEIANLGDELSSYYKYNPYAVKTKKFVDLLTRATTALKNDYKHRYRDGNDIPDTGKHTGKFLLRTQLQNLAGSYSQHKKDNDLTADGLENEKTKLNQTQWSYNTGKSTVRDRISNVQSINHDLAKLIILKAYAKKLRQKYKQQRDDAINSYDSDIKHTTWAQLSFQKERIETRIKNLTEELLNYQKQLADVNNRLTPEAQEEFEEIVDSKLDNISTEYDKVVAQIEQLTKRKPITEDLDESYLRIYTRDFDGKEDFVDDFYTFDEAKECFQDLMDSGDFEQVCLVSINGDDVEVVCDSCEEEGDCDITECAKPEKLTEGKSFNLKDSDDVINAQAYKAVGDHKDDELVVVDPSVESTDDEFAPHVGDAILQCPSCKTTFFLDPDKLEKDEESDKYNLEMPCPHCGAKGGFDYLFQAADKDSLDAEKESSEEQEAEPEDKLEPVEDDLVDVDDVEEIKEESFEKLVNPYLTKLYENVKGFKVTNVSMPHHNQIIVEGNLQSFSGKEKLVEFVLNATKKENGKVILEGFNTKLTGDSKKAYTLMANVNDNNLIFESFNYKYTKNIGGQNILIEGVEK